MIVSINKVFLPEDLQACLDIRKTVFVLGQNVPQSEEIDGKDPVSDHYLLTLDNNPAGVARVRYIDAFAKIERVAILDEYQGRGLGAQLMMAILSDLKRSTAVTVAKLSSQTYAISFYVKLGFMVCSEEYMDANIPHQDMYLRLYNV